MSHPWLARNETKAVWWLKGVVIAVLIIAAVVMGLATHWFATSTENEQFESQFIDDATRLKREVYHSSAQRVWVAVSLSIRISAEAILNSHSPINTTLVDFDYVGLPLLHLSGADSISFAPILTNETRKDWELFAASNQLWIDPFNAIPPSDDIRPIEDGIWELNEEFDAVDDSSPSGKLLSPIWQTTPMFLRRNMIMHNAYSEPVRRQAIDIVMKTKKPVVSGVLRHSSEAQFQNNYIAAPRSIVVNPVINFAGEQEVSGVILIEFRWDSIFENVLQDETSVHAVVENSCNDMFTLEITGSHVKHLGEGDHHDSRYDPLRVSTNYGELADWFNERKLLYPPPPGYDENFGLGGTAPEDMCTYLVHFYPTAQFENSFSTNQPARFAVIVAMIFVFAICVFVVYDCLVERRQSVVMNTAVNSTNIVNQLYPPEFIDRVIQPRDQEDGNSKVRGATKMTPSMLRSTHNLQDFLTDSSSDHTLQISRPIAEMFPDVTVIFADISGFTAWSSEREPIQVFKLLEALYAAFDEAGKRLGVFKVETIGDCYVAVVGLPAPHQAHAVVMCRFAHEIQKCMSNLTKRLEVQLGPGTSDLQLRIGLHSGSVIAGILRGEKSRFQLFGDTMNTAARMESTGERGKTQVSEATAESLTAAGKHHWLIPRKELVNAKGKGELQTYWVNPSRSRDAVRGKRLSKYLEKAKQEEIQDVKRPSDISTTSSEQEEINLEEMQDVKRGCDNSTTHTESWSRLSLDETYFNETEVGKKARLIEWNTEVLLTLLGRLEARRQRVSAVDAVQGPESSPAKHCLYRQESDLARCSTFGHNDTKLEDCGQNVASSPSHGALGCCARNECGAYDKVALPAFNAKVARYPFETCNLSVRVREQLRDYVAEIADLYNNDLPFHNFEHASHVALSSLKLLNRIIMPDSEWNIRLAAERHVGTFGVASDPLTHFVVVLAAMVHDVGHPGIPNSELVSSEHELATTYGSQSVAEWHSIYIATKTLEKYPELEEQIYSTPHERERFHELLRHSVLATDIMGADSARRWSKAFGATVVEDDKDSLLNRKASIVLELIIQASDVAHIMQHWHIYCKWNEKLFFECYSAFQNGSSSDDPTHNWYQGELGFLDHYVLPLAKRLKECGVYGVSSAEYYGFAVENRREWEMKGQDVVQAMLHRAQKKYPTKSHAVIGAKERCGKQEDACTSKVIMGANGMQRDGGSGGADQGLASLLYANITESHRKSKIIEQETAVLAPTDYE